MNPNAPTPNAPNPYEQMRDQSHLRLLVIFHYIMGVLEILGGIFLVGVTFWFNKMFSSLATMSPGPGTTTAVGGATPPAAPAAPVAIPTTPPAGGTPLPSGGATPLPSTPPTGPSAESAEAMEAVTDMVFVFYGSMALVVIVLGILTLLAAHGLRKRKWEILCFISAAILCLNVPLGTALGVFTFIVLLRPTVSQLFKKNQSTMA